MDSVATSGSRIARCKQPEKTRRSWRGREEDVLIQSLNDVMTKGWKSENGFKAGYLTLLENAMQKAIPGTNIRGNPHINSKIHVWKKTYSTLVTLLSKSGVGWNDTDNTIDVTDETWESILKVCTLKYFELKLKMCTQYSFASCLMQHDPSFRAMRHKQWMHFNDWGEIFGNDRAIGEHSKNFENALQQVLKLGEDNPNKEFIGETRTFIPFDGADDSISETHTPTSKTNAGTSSKSKKKKHTSDHDVSIVEAINNLAHITKDTMSQLIKEISAEDKISDVQDTVLDALQGLTELSEDEQVAAAKLLFNNHNDLALFKRLGERGRICLVKRLLRGE
ncbi:uncharacterized protein [Primulina eburnea]|uniref:uncharacterized protein n=1 Tax=Primulina eburnea TaxID=1245227 RepID=UPI003C6C72C8